MKLVFNITEKGSWVEIEQPDGTMKNWSEELTDQEYAQIAAAGLVMQRCTLMHAMLPALFSKDKNPQRLERIEKHLNKAEELVKKIFNVE